MQAETKKPEPKRRETKKLDSLKIKAASSPGYYSDGNGLYLQVSKFGTKSWVFRYTLNGKKREMGLGSVSSIGLKIAREKAEEKRSMLVDGIDPIAARIALREQSEADLANQITFRNAAKAYIKAHSPGWKNKKHAGQWTNTLETYCGPVFGDVFVSEIDTPLILRALEPIWTDKNETATRVRARIENVLSWATVRGYRAGDNPARWVGNLKQLLPAIKKSGRVKHHPALPYAEINGLIKDLRGREGVSPLALEFLILTAARTSEVLNAVPAEFNLKEAVWTIPASKMKSGKAHRVPLCPRALAIAKQMIAKDGKYVFNSQRKDKPLSSMALLVLLRDVRKGIVVHGFRSSFRDWAAERTNYPREVCEASLAHTVGNAAELAYKRTDLFNKRRRLMNDWAAFCEQGKLVSKVTPIRAA